MVPNRYLRRIGFPHQNYFELRNFFTIYGALATKIYIYKLFKSFLEKMCVEIHRSFSKTEIALTSKSLPKFSIIQ